MAKTNDTNDRLNDCTTNVGAKLAKTKLKSSLKNKASENTTSEKPPQQTSHPIKKTIQQIIKEVTSGSSSRSKHKQKIIVITTSENESSQDDPLDDDMDADFIPTKEQYMEVKDDGEEYETEAESTQPTVKKGRKVKNPNTKKASTSRKKDEEETNSTENQSHDENIQKGERCKETHCKKDFLHQGNTENKRLWYSKKSNENWKYRKKPT